MVLQTNYPLVNKFSELVVYTPLNNMTLSVGIMKFPIYGHIKIMRTIPLYYARAVSAPIVVHWQSNIWTIPLYYARAVSAPIVVHWQSNIWTIPLYYARAVSAPVVVHWQSNIWTIPLYYARAVSAPIVAHWQSTIWTIPVIMPGLSQLQSWHTDKVWQSNI